MSSKQEIRDWTGKILGYIEEESNGDVIARAFSGLILGKYDKAFDVTRDFSGKILFKGNQAAALVTMNKDE